jgi:ATP-dependent Clp protease ATP-binding subunit ClpC
VGYEEGGHLTEKVRRRPYAVVLLDEIEKAHPDIFNMLLQIMEEGRLTDSFGRNIDFRNVVLIMTSNIGANLIKNSAGLGFSKSTGGSGYEKMKEMIVAEVERHFRPEFLNRLDELVVFNQLNRKDMEAIVKIELRKVSKRLEHKHVTLDVGEDVLNFMIDKSFHEEFGARPLKRAIERHIEDPLAEEMLRGKLDQPSVVTAYLEEGQIQFKFEEKRSEHEPDAEAVGTKDADATGEGS